VPTLVDFEKEKYAWEKKRENIGKNFVTLQMCGRGCTEALAKMSKVRIHPSGYVIMEIIGLPSP
jgi:hypothetical protein